MKQQIGFSVLLLVALGFISSAADSPVPVPHHDWSFKEAGLIPVQSGGRIKPFDSYAREIVLFLTGSTLFKAWDPSDWVLSVIAKPEYWEKQPIIKIGNKELLKQLVLDPSRSRYSPNELFNNSTLAQYAQGLAAKESSRPGQAQQTNNPNQTGSSPREQELNHVLSRLTLLRQLTSGGAILLIPTVPPAPWLSIIAGVKVQQPIAMGFLRMMKAYYQADGSAFQTQANLLKQDVESQVPGWTDSTRKTLKAEWIYNQTRPFGKSSMLYLIAALLWSFGILFSDPHEQGASARLSRKFFYWGGLACTSAGMLIHLFGFLLRCYIAGRPPVSNMYESIVWVSFGVMFFAMILFATYRHWTIPAVSCTLGAFGLFAADSSPAIMDPSIHPLVPVLRSNFWLSTHVLTITLSYAAFALSLGIANTTLYQYLRQALGKIDRNTAHKKIALLNQFTYRAMQFGVVLLAAGTILGGVWADYSWGRFWGWDPKETWALITLLCYLAILHGRFAGWVAQFSFAVWSVVSFLSVIMAWYGVNFVLGVGLHSYGFSTGGGFGVAVFILAQLTYVAVVTGLRVRSR